jgi:group I intron endonuclease
VLFRNGGILFKEYVMDYGGIYEIINKVNGKRYVGSSINIRRRWNEHKSELSLKCHSNSHLQNSWNKYGEDAFSFEVLIYTEPEEALRLENLLLKSGKYEYNLAKDATAPMLGKHHTKKAKERISRAMSGENHPMWGRHHSEKTKRKISKNHPDISGKNNPCYGRVGKNHPMYGKVGKDSPRYGIHHTEETQEKISQALVGRHISEETKRKMSEALSGRTLSEEHKRKLSEMQKKHWARKRGEI